MTGGGEGGGTKGFPRLALEDGNLLGNDELFLKCCPTDWHIKIRHTLDHPWPSKYQR